MKLVLGILLVLMGAFGIVGFSAISIQRRAAVNDMYDSLSVLARENAKSVHQFLGRHWDALAIISQGLDTVFPDLQSQVGFLLHEAERSPYEQLMLISECSGVDAPEACSWEVIEKARLGRYSVSDLFVNEDGVPVLAFAIPAAEGVLYAEARADHLNDLLIDSQHGRFGSAFVLDSSGSLQFSGRHMVDEIRVLTDRAISIEEWLGDFLRFLSETQGTSEGTGSYQFLDSTVLAAYARIPNTEWILFQSSPTDAILTSVRDFHESFLWIFSLTTLVTGLTLTWYSGRFVRPIVELDSLFGRAS